MSIAPFKNKLHVIILKKSRNKGVQGSSLALNQAYLSSGAILASTPLINLLDFSSL